LRDVLGARGHDATDEREPSGTDAREEDDEHVLVTA